MKVFDDLCDQLEYTRSEELILFSAKKSISDPAVQDHDGSITNSNSSSASGNFSKQQLINRAEEVKSIFKEFDALFGPVLLFLLVSSFIGILNGANDLFLEKITPIRISINLLRIFTETFVLLFMEMGHVVKFRVSSVNGDSVRVIAHIHICIPTSSKFQLLLLNYIDLDHR